MSLDAQRAAKLLTSTTREFLDAVTKSLEPSEMYALYQSATKSRTTSRAISVIAADSRGEGVANARSTSALGPVTSASELRLARAPASCP